MNTQPQWFEELQNFTDKVGLKQNQFISIAPFQQNQTSAPPSRNENRPPPSRLSSRQGSRLSSRGSARNSMQKIENDFVRRQCSAASVVKAANKSSDLYGTEMLKAMRQDMAGKDVIVDDKESFVS